jgi:hypothetical protein
MDGTPEKHAANRWLPKAAAKAVAVLGTKGVAVMYNIVAPPFPNWLEALTRRGQKNNQAMVSARIRMLRRIGYVAYEMP